MDKKKLEAIVFNSFDYNTRQRISCLCRKYGINYPRAEAHKKRADGFSYPYILRAIGLAHIDSLIDSIQSQDPIKIFKDGRIVDRSYSIGVLVKELGKFRKRYIEAYDNLKGGNNYGLSRT